jgi:membrane-bound lytic murein transglycosylase B
MFGVVVVASLLFAGAAAAPPLPTRMRMARQDAITPVAAVARVSGELSGPLVVAATRSQRDFHVVASTGTGSGVPAPPPPIVVVNSAGAMRIPTVALSAYRNAERMMAASDPGCGVSWNLLAGIGRIESMHANGGATDIRGTALRPIYGPTLDGTLPGNEIIVQSSAGGRVTYARAVGPMQFLPGTWARYASDADGDGVADPQNLFDSALAAGRYLCSGGLNLRDKSQVMTAVLRYNNSMPYTQNVLGWAAAYATGVAPIALPPIVGPPPPLGDIHLESPEGIGPGLPLNIHGLPSTDPLAQMPLIDFGQLSGDANQQPWSHSRTASREAGCTLICIEGQNPPPAPSPEPQAGPPPAEAP